MDGTAIEATVLKDKSVSGSDMDVPLICIRSNHVGRSSGHGRLAHAVSREQTKEDRPS